MFSGLLDAVRRFLQRPRQAPGAAPGTKLVPPVRFTSPFGGARPVGGKTSIGTAVNRTPVDWSAGDQPTPPKLNWWATSSQDNYYKKTPDLTKPSPNTFKPNMQNAAKRKMQQRYV